MRLKTRICLTIFCSIVLFTIPSKSSFAYKQPDKGAIEVIEDILSRPDPQIDLYPKSLEMQLGDKGAAPVGHSRQCAPALLYHPHPCGRDTPSHGIHKAAYLALYTPFAPMSLVH